MSQENAQHGDKANIFKANIPKPSDFHGLTELTDYVDERVIVKPGLITSLVAPFFETHNSRSFTYDTVQTTAQIPNSKTFTNRGDFITQDGENDKAFSIPSMGWQLMLSPSDYIGKRMPGTANEFQTEAYALGKLITKGDAGWDLHTELGLAQLLTTDTNFLGTNAIGTAYNFYTEIEGAPRGATTDVLLGTAADPIATIRGKKKELMQYAARNQLSGTVVMLCGDTFFNSRLALEAQEGLARPLMTAKDLAVEEVGYITNNAWNYDMFKGSRDGIVYINYGAEIIAGTNLVADNAAYMFLAGSGVMGIHFAPARTRTHANKEAQTMYRWSSEYEFAGVRLMMESNRLFFNQKPGSIIRLTSST